MLSVMLQLDYAIIEYFSSAPQPERNDSFMTIDSGSDFRDAVTNETGTKKFCALFENFREENI